MTQFNGKNPLEIIAKALEQGLQGNPIIEIIGDENHPFIKDLKKKAAEQQINLQEFIKKGQEENGDQFKEVVDQLKDVFQMFGQGQEFGFGEEEPKKPEVQPEEVEIPFGDFEHLSLEQVEEQVRFWTKLRDFKLEEKKKENVAKKQIEELTRQLATYQEQLEKLNKELPTVMATDMGKAQEYFYQMATITHSIEKLKEQILQLKG